MIGAFACGLSRSGFHEDRRDVGSCEHCGTTVELRVGREYVAIGPASGSKLGPAQVCTVVAVDFEAGVYRTEGARQVAPVIAFGAEHMWKPAEAALGV